jgi:hypothetical protein
MSSGSLAPFKAVMFHDGEFVRRKGFAAVDISERLIKKLEIRGEPSIPELLKDFGHMAIRCDAHAVPTGLEAAGIPLLW